MTEENTQNVNQNKSINICGLLSFIFSMVGILMFGLPCGIIATILGIIGIAGKKATIRESAKLIVATREIFLNDEHDIAYSNTVYEQYVEKIRNVEHGLVELKLKKDVATNEEKKKLKREIKNAEESIKAMKIARQSMLKYNSSFEIGMNMQNRH